MNEIRTLNGEVFYIPDPCEHPDPEPVVSVVDGSLLAWLCVECDAQLPACWGEPRRRWLDAGRA